MTAKTMREVLENVSIKDVAEEIRKLSLPENTYVRVIIETRDELLPKKETRQGSADDRFLSEIDNMPAADDLPKDLAHQHDHYLYGLPPKK